MVYGLTVFVLVATILPALMVMWNLGAFGRLPRRSRPEHRAGVSVLIPARNEERCIGEAVRAVLANRDVELELIVLDDQSTDATAKIVREIAAEDDRVRVESAPPMPAGWCGKQHACYALSRMARHELMVFIDADVRLGDDALGRIADYMADHPGVELLSGFPKQETRTLGEKLVIPLINYVLLAYLPLRWSRVMMSPGFGAGCGQLFIARRGSYEAVGGHGAVRSSLHDGVKLPRAYRRAGYMTDLFDAVDVARCRMYRGLGELWRGLAKNAIEGLGAPGAIGWWTAMLLGAGVGPMLLVGLAVGSGEGSLHQAAWCAVGFMYLPRWLLAVRLGQSWLGAMGHPVGLVMLTAIQWHGLIRHVRGIGPSWKGREYAR